MSTLERDLYPSIDGFLQSRGFTVFDELMMHTGLGGMHRVDHVGFRWDADELKLVMVEVKPGDTPNDAANALGQAIAYQCAADLVWIAAEGDVAEPDGGSLREILTHLTLGYLIAERDSSKVATEVLKPQSSVTRTNKLIERNTARVRMLHLFSELGALTSARDRRADAWAVFEPEGGWQVGGSVLDNGDTFVSLLAETLQAGRQAARTCDAHRLAAVIRSDAPDAKLILQRRVHNGYRPHYFDSESWSSESSDASLEAMITRARSMMSTRTSPQLQLLVPLWKVGTHLDPVAARAELKAAIEHARRLLHSALL